MAASSTYLRHDGVAAHSWIAMALGMLGLALGCGYALALGELIGLYVGMSLVYAVAVLFDFRVGAVALLMLLPLSASALFPHGMMGITGLNPLNMVLLATLAGYVLHAGVRGAVTLAPKVMIWCYVVPIVIAALIGMGSIRGIPSFFYEMGAITFVTSMQYLMIVMVKPLVMVAVALVVGAAAARSRRPELFIVPIACSVLMMAAIQLGFVIKEGAPLAVLVTSEARGFYEPLGMHANSFGRLHLFGLTLLLFVWAETREAKLRLFLTFVIGVVSIALILTFSRAAIGAAGIVGALFLMWKFNARTLAFAMIGLALLAMFGADLIYARMTKGFGEGVDSVSAGRVDGIWLPLLPEIGKSPVWGSGLSSILWSTPMVTEAMSRVGHPHNAYLEALLDMGIIGLALLGAFYLNIWRGFRAISGNADVTPELRGLFQGATAAMVAFLVTCLVGSSLRPEPESAYLWFAIGLMYGLRGRKPAS